MTDKNKQKKINWFWFFIFFVIMTIIGFIVFDDIAAKLIFSVVVGGLFGWIFSTRKTYKK
ncbi:MAG: hypothetical protein ACTHVM_06995 [Alkalibacterium gilvum]|uniref:hypothetical protein n=1 Tax=Alkalibacterium gilvum TaxID=1130080 RepID=UPI003F903635